MNIAGGLRQVSGDLIGNDALAGELHSVFKVLELIRLSLFQCLNLRSQKPHRAAVFSLSRAEIFHYRESRDSLTNHTERRARDFTPVRGREASSKHTLAGHETVAVLCLAGANGSVPNRQEKT